MQRYWNILGIQPTNDKKAIKKAYAANVKECHPEDSPQEYKNLREAYEFAMRYAAINTQTQRCNQIEHEEVIKAGSKPIITDTTEGLRNHQNERQVDIASADPFNSLSENVYGSTSSMMSAPEELQEVDVQEPQHLFQDEFLHMQHQEDEILTGVFHELEALNRNEKKRIEPSAWLAILQRSDVCKVRDRLSFARALYAFIMKEEELCKAVKGAISKELQLQNYLNGKHDDVYEKLYRLLGAATLDYTVRQQPKIQPYKLMIALFLFAVGIYTLIGQATKPERVQVTPNSTLNKNYNMVYREQIQETQREMRYYEWVDQLTVEASDDGSDILYLNNEEGKQPLCSGLDIILPYAKVQVVLDDAGYRFYSYTKDKKLTGVYQEVYPLDPFNDNQFQDVSEENADRHTIDYFIVKEKDTYYIVNDEGEKIQNTEREQRSDYDHKTLEYIDYQYELMDIDDAIQQLGDRNEASNY